MSEKLCLQWNDFKENINSAFGRLKDDKEFVDVTLACEDGQQAEAHKVILAASSPFFEKILSRNKHPHPLTLMGGRGEGFIQYKVVAAQGRGCFTLCCYSLHLEPCTLCC